VRPVLIVVDLVRAQIRRRWSWFQTRVRSRSSRRHPPIQRSMVHSCAVPGQDHGLLIAAEVAGLGQLLVRAAERYPVLEFIESASQRPYAVEDQRALGGRVTLTNVRFGPLIARRIPAAGLIVLASSRHSTSVADHDR